MSQPVLSQELTTPAQTKPLRVLLSAYACEPGRGSEPGVGWNVAREVAQYHQTWVLTASTHRDLIEAELQNHPIPNLHVVYLDPLGWVFDWSQEGKRLPWDVQLHYYLWQIKAYFVAKGLHQAVRFDLAHHVTYVKYFSPSFVSLLPMPFLWGPVGGGESTPEGFAQDISKRGKLYESLRDLARYLGELDPFVRLTARCSQQIWATTEDTAKCLYRVGATSVQIISQIGLNEEEIATLTSYASIYTEQQPVRFVSIGRLLHWKGFHLGLKAFAQATLPEDAEYWIVGEGPEMPLLQELAKELDIAHRVKFWNKLPRTETLQRLGECLALVHPSLHDSGGLVCLEAMAAGCPVICLNIGGPGTLVTPDTGFKVPAHTPEQAIQDLAKAMVKLVSDPDLRQRMGSAGQQRVREAFVWQHKAEQFNQIYQQIVMQKALAESSLGGGTQEV